MRKTAIRSDWRYCVMAFCPNCGGQVADGAAFCPQCGTGLNGAAPAVQVNVYDHTAEFDPQDISDNKVYAMLCYLAGTLGIIIALLASHESPYLRFHSPLKGLFQ